MFDPPVTTSSEEETIAIAKNFAARLASGDSVALCGGLGAGKTHFAKGIAAGLGSSSTITSPTFALVNEIEDGRLPLFHFDFYRVESIEELLRIGWDDYLDEPGVVLVEWADRFPELLPDQTIWLDLTVGEDGSRTISRR